MKLGREFEGIVILLATLAAPIATHAQVVTEVVSFTGNNSQGYPNVSPIQGRDGNLYGTCPNPQGAYGSIFSLTFSGVLSNFYTFSQTTGFFPVGLTLATDGNFYGTAQDGGTGSYGTLYRIDAHGNYRVLHDFLGGADGAGPGSPPIEGSDGNLYGTTTGAGGIFGSTVYKYNRSGTYTTIFQFNNTQAEDVFAPLVQGSDGNLYGSAWIGGANHTGSVFKLSTAGKLFYLYSFPAQGTVSHPLALMQASDGNLYGTTSYNDGGGGSGTIFRMNRKSGAISVIYNFTGGSDGATPEAGLFEGTDGYLYGTTALKGANFYGTIFRISLSGAFETLYSLSQPDGYAAGSPLQHTSGIFYGAFGLGSTYGFGAIYSLDMGLGPFITFVQPTGKVGKSAQILGQGLTGTTSVTFHGLPSSSFKVVSDTYMTAVVPSGATTGPVVVTTPTGTLTSNVNFRVTP